MKLDLWEIFHYALETIEKKDAEIEALKAEVERLKNIISEYVKEADRAWSGDDLDYSDSELK